MTREEIHNNILEIRREYKEYLKLTDEDPYWVDNEGYFDYMRINQLIFDTIEAGKEYGMELDLWKYAWEV